MCSKAGETRSGGGSVGEDAPHEAGGEVGLEESLAEIDVDKILAGVVVLEVEALEVAVVPGVVRVWDARGDQLLLGGVPVVVASHEGGGGERQQGNQDNESLHL